MNLPNSLPDYYDDLALSFEEAWSLIAAGVTNRNSPSHMPAVGTVDPLGVPHMRIMILRDASRDKRTLRFHTDSRSIKAEQLSQNPATSVLIYDTAAKVQIRMSGKAHVTATSDMADTAWSTSTPAPWRRRPRPPRRPRRNRPSGRAIRCPPGVSRETHGTGVASGSPSPQGARQNPRPHRGKDGVGGRPPGRPEVAHIAWAASSDKALRTPCTRRTFAVMVWPFIRSWVWMSPLDLPSR